MNELESIQSSLALRIEKAKELKTATEQVDIGAMTKSFKRCRDMLDRQENLLKLHIAELEGANQKLMENYQQQLESNEQDLRRQKEFVRSVMTDNEYVQLLQAKEQLASFAKQTAEEFDDLKPPTRVKYDIPGLNDLQTFTNELSQKLSIVTSTPGNSCLTISDSRAHLRMQTGREKKFRTYSLFRTGTNNSTSKTSTTEIGMFESFI